MKCSVCGSDNLEGSAYCEDCGSRLAMTPAAPVMAAPAPVPYLSRPLRYPFPQAKKLPLPFPWNLRLRLCPSLHPPLLPPRWRCPLPSPRGLSCARHAGL